MLDKLRQLKQKLRKDNSRVNSLIAIQVVRPAPMVQFDKMPYGSGPGGSRIEGIKPELLLILRAGGMCGKCC